MVYANRDRDPLVSSLTDADLAEVKVDDGVFEHPVGLAIVRRVMKTKYFTPDPVAVLLATPESKRSATIFRPVYGLVHPRVNFHHDGITMEDFAQGFLVPGDQIVYFTDDDNDEYRTYHTCFATDFERALRRDLEMLANFYRLIEDGKVVDEDIRLWKLQERNPESTEMAEKLIGAGMADSPKRQYQVRFGTKGEWRDYDPVNHRVVA